MTEVGWMIVAIIVIALLCIPWLYAFWGLRGHVGPKLSLEWEVPPDAMRSVLPRNLNAYGEEPPHVAKYPADFSGKIASDDSLTHRSVKDGTQHLGSITKCGACK